MRSASLLLLWFLAAAPAGTPELTEHRFTGFPALAKGGKLVALVDTEVAEASSNDHFESGTLRLISVANGKDLKTIELQFLKSDEEALDEAFQGRLAAAQALLKKDEYRSLPVLETGSTDAGLSTAYTPPALSLVDGAGKQLLATKLPILKEQDPVCLSDESITDKKTCERLRLPQFERAWIEEAKRIFVVQYGYYEGRDGTERGPEFVVLKF